MAFNNAEVLGDGGGGRQSGSDSVFSAVRLHKKR